MRQSLQTLFGVLILSTACFAQQVSLAAASDLTAVMKELAVRYEAKTGHQLKASFGSSGNFYAQISNGAPFDVFMSADVEYPRRLLVDGLAEPGTLFSYAIGQLVIWVPNGSPIDVGRLHGDALLQASIKKIAIANPQHAPYGRAAVAAMKSFGLYEKVQNKLVFGENISQVAQFLKSGTADIGIIALSLALSPEMKDSGRYWQIDSSVFPPLEQAAVVLKSSPNKAAAMSFIEFLRSSEGQEIFRRYGFMLPAKKRY